MNLRRWLVRDDAHKNVGLYIESNARAAMLLHLSKSEVRYDHARRFSVTSIEENDADQICHEFLVTLSIQDQDILDGAPGTLDPIPESYSPDYNVALIEEVGGVQGSTKLISVQAMTVRGALRAAFFKTMHFGGYVIQRADNLGGATHLCVRNNGGRIVVKSALGTEIPMGDMRIGTDLL